MRASHVAVSESTFNSPSLNKLQALIAERQSTSTCVSDFQAFEEQLRALTAEVEREVLANELARFDIDARAVMVGGVVHRRVLRCEAPYLTRAGVVRVKRSLYRAAGNSKAICPLELRAGIVEGYWSPAAAHLGIWAVAHMTSYEAAELFERTGGMTPSRTNLQRLPTKLSERWEEQRERFENAVRIDAPPVPQEATTVAVSLDGVMASMRDGQRQAKRDAAKTAGKETRGPAGYQEVGCATLTFYDTVGERLTTRYLARMPEKYKKTLKQMVDDELKHILCERPDLKLVYVADGAPDNWKYFETVRAGDGEKVLDFYHAVEHLKAAVDVAYGPGSPLGEAAFQQMRSLLRNDIDGASKVINRLAYLHKKYPRRKKLKTVLRYFRLHRKHMNYARLSAANLPIGSGTVEAANKTIVAVRMKRAGSRWTEEGGQAILTFRCLAKSHRIDPAWRVLRATYQSDIHVPGNGELSFRKAA